ncbi:hypothetical protein JCM9534A_74000 [Catenuloplanes indicus JCM 9534]
MDPAAAPSISPRMWSRTLYCSLATCGLLNTAPSVTAADAGPALITAPVMAPTIAAAPAAMSRVNGM